MSFASFIDLLARTKVGENTFNPYSFADPANQVRRNNLILYFNQIKEREPEVLLVGEAPGYQGCRFTGVPFCSEYLILNGIEEIGKFGKDRGYGKTKEVEKVWKEPSATIVWGALKTLPRLPLLWASFPFHPHKPGNPLSNRTPTREEIKSGQVFITEIIKMFGIEKIIAVGNKAHESLGELGYEVPKIRHPANGGKNLFVEGINFHLG